MLSNLKLFSELLSLTDYLLLFFFHPEILLLNLFDSLGCDDSSVFGLTTLLNFPVCKFCHLTALLLEHLDQRGLEKLVVGELA